MASEIRCRFNKKVGDSGIHQTPKANGIHIEATEIMTSFGSHLILGQSMNDITALKGRGSRSFISEKFINRVKRKIA